MFVKIGPYPRDIIPTDQWEKKYLSWRHSNPYFPEDQYDQMDTLVTHSLQTLGNLVAPINQWSNSRSRKLKIHIHNYDVWNMNHTLALIILPMLKRLKENKMGSPYIDPLDVPEHLRPITVASAENSYVDSTHHERFDWFLSELIWAFEQHASDDEDEQFHHNSENLKMNFEPVEGTEACEIKMVTIDPNKPAYFYDKDTHMRHEERKHAALMLFGKYYSTLWD